MPTVIIETIIAFAIVGEVAILGLLKIPKGIIAGVLAVTVFALFILHIL